MLLDAQGNLKIADFGLCSVYKYKGKERTLHGMCGSLPYIAPEMDGHPYMGEPIDVGAAADTGMELRRRAVCAPGWQYVKLLTRHAMGRTNEPQPGIRRVPHRRAPPYGPVDAHQRRCTLYVRRLTQRCSAG